MVIVYWDLVPQLALVSFAYSFVLFVVSCLFITCRFLITTQECSTLVPVGLFDNLTQLFTRNCSARSCFKRDISFVQRWLHAVSTVGKRNKTHYNYIMLFPVLIKNQSVVSQLSSTFTPLYFNKNFFFFFRLIMKILASS